MSILFRKFRSILILINSRVYTLLYRTFFIFDTSVSINKDCLIDTGVKLRATDGGSISLGSGCYLGRGSVIIASGCNISIGNNVHIGYGSIIVARSGISIGSDCLIAEYVVIRDQDHDFRGSPIRAGGFLSSPISIGSDVWIGSKASVLKGVSIGDGAIVGANSLVRTDILARAIAVGLPAKIVKMRNIDV